jgi:sensor histidine kinase YesM
MEFSLQPTISLEKEMNYIKKYLQLEQMRFGNRFQYKVEAGNIENTDRLQIPVMLIQPFVENAVRHGVRYRMMIKD